MSIEAINDDNFESEVINADGPCFNAGRGRNSR